MMSWIESIFEGQVLESLIIISVLLGCIYILMEFIPKIPVLRKLTSIPFLFLVPMLLSNVKVIPANYPLYKPLQEIVLYLAIFFMVVNIDIKVIVRTLQPRLFLLFFLACLGTVAGATIAYLPFTKIIGAENSAFVAAATTGIYTGGSMNWVAVASALQMPGNLNAAAFPATIIIFTLYLAGVVSLQGGAVRRRLDRWLGYNSAIQTLSSKSIKSNGQNEKIHFKDFITGFFYFGATYAVSMIISKQIESYIFIPVVILVTSVALILGNVFKLKKLKGTPAFGEACLYFLLTIIGAQGNLTETLSNAPVLLLFPIIVIIIHVVVLIVSARILKTDFITTSITTVAAIGGGASAPIVAAIYNKRELIPVAIILGSLGYAIGNYLGIYLGLLLINI